LRRRIARRASRHSPSVGGRRKTKPLSGMSVKKLRRDSIECACEDSAEAQTSKSLEDSKGAKLRRNNVSMHALKLRVRSSQEEETDKG